MPGESRKFSFSQEKYVEFFPVLPVKVGGWSIVQIYFLTKTKGPTSLQSCSTIRRHMAIFILRFMGNVLHYLIDIVHYLL